MEPIINQAPTPLPKNKTWLWILLIIVVAILAGGAVYYWQSMEAKKSITANEDKIRSEMQTKITSAENKISELENKLSEQQKNIEGLTTKTNSNIFDPSTLKVGDQVAGMIVVSTGPVNTKKPLHILDNYRASFSGQANVSGKLYLSDMFNKYCFDVNQSDWSKLPKSYNDSRKPWFCFINADEASTTSMKESLSQNSDVVNITIDDYIINQYPAEVSNTATLIKINP